MIKEINYSGCCTPGQHFVDGEVMDSGEEITTNIFKHNF